MVKSAKKCHLYEQFESFVNLAVLINHDSDKANQLPAKLCKKHHDRARFML